MFFFIRFLFSKVGFFSYDFVKRQAFYILKVGLVLKKIRTIFCLKLVLILKEIKIRHFFKGKPNPALFWDDYYDFLKIQKPYSEPFFKIIFKNKSKFPKTQKFKLNYARKRKKKITTFRTSGKKSSLIVQSLH